MYFVGRKREQALITKSLNRSENIIISGRFGMGRTSLMYHLAEVRQDQWRFIFCDFLKTPGDICRHLLTELFPAYAGRRSKTYVQYKPGRFQIMNRPPEDHRRHILVLDNIERLSMQKHELLRYLTSVKRFLFVAIVACFLPESDLHHLKVTLLASRHINLEHLDRTSARDFFRHFSFK